MSDNARDIIFEVQRVSPNEFAVAPHFPDLAEKSVGEALAPRAAAKDHNITAEKSRARREVDARFATQAGARAQDRLGRPKFESCAGTHPQGLARSPRSPHRPLE